MLSWNSHAWGPHPKHAVVPVMLVLCVVAWVAATNPGPAAVADATPVTVMKPIEGTDAGPPPSEMPIEIRYGVPSERTRHVWLNIHPLYVPPAR